MEINLSSRKADNKTPGFCMCRIVTMVLRITWACYQHNVRLAIAAAIFVQAGTLLLYVVNLVFAQRIIRAQHPRLGWHRLTHVLGRLLILAIILTLALLIASVVQQSYTLNTNTHRIDRDLQLYGSTFYAVVAFLPIPLVGIGILIPRRIRTEKFGKGRFRYKISILLLASTLCTIRAAFGAGINWPTPTPMRAPEPWYLSKACFYGFYFTPEVLVAALYALVRVDRRFHIPNGVHGSYMPGYVPRPIPGASDAIYMQPEYPSDQVLRVYSEEELFEDTHTLADTLKFSNTTLNIDRGSGKWELKRHSAQSLYSQEEGNRDSIAASRHSRAPSTWSYF
jgi:hypothetical protein